MLNENQPQKHYFFMLSVRFGQSIGSVLNEEQGGIFDTEGNEKKSP